MKNILLIILTNLVLGLAAQVEIPAPKQTKKILLLNGTAHVGNGKIIENAAIAFEEDKPLTNPSSRRPVYPEPRGVHPVPSRQRIWV